MYPYKGKMVNVFVNYNFRLLRDKDLVMTTDQYKIYLYYRFCTIDDKC